MRFRHYGASVQKLIEKAIEMPEGPKKEGLVEVIASYMKLAYKTWNKEHYVSDDIVKEDLIHLSNGKLELHEGHSSLDTLSMYADNQSQGGNRPQGRGGQQRGNNMNKKKNKGPGGNMNQGGPYKKRKR